MSWGSFGCWLSLINGLDDDFLIPLVKSSILKASDSSDDKIRLEVEQTSSSKSWALDWVELNELFAKEFELELIIDTPVSFGKSGSFMLSLSVKVLFELVKLRVSSR